MIALLRRDLALALRAGGGAASALLFHLAVVVAVPFAVGPDKELLATVGPAMLWVGGLLATLLGLERLFQSDRDDGALDALMTARAPLPALVLSKCIAHAVTTALPVAVSTPVFAVLLGLEGPAVWATVATLAVGAPALAFIGAVGAAVTVGLPRGGLLLAVLTLPLCVPTLIFGVGAVRAAVTEPDPFWPPFALTAAITLFFAVLGPFAAAAALRLGR